MKKHMRSTLIFNLLFGFVFFTSIGIGFAIMVKAEIMSTILVLVIWSVCMLHTNFVSLEVTMAEGGTTMDYVYRSFFSTLSVLVIMLIVIWRLGGIETVPSGMWVIFTTWVGGVLLSPIVFVPLIIKEMLSSDAKTLRLRFFDACRKVVKRYLVP